MKRHCTNENGFPVNRVNPVFAGIAANTANTYRLRDHCPLMPFKGIFQIRTAVICCQTIGFVRRISSVFSRPSAYTLKSRKLRNRQHSLPRSSFFITILREFRAVRVLHRMRNSVNGTTPIGKSVKWVYRFCFREAVLDKKEAMQSHRFLQISYGARVAPQRCPILRLSKAITIMSKSNRNYSFVSVDAFSFVR